MLLSRFLIAKQGGSEVPAGVFHGARRFSRILHVLAVDGLKSQILSLAEISLQLTFQQQSSLNFAYR